MYVVRIIHGRKSSFLKETKFSYVRSDDVEDASVYPSAQEGLEAASNYTAGEDPSGKT
jgi:hypothetical protein